MRPLAAIVAMVFCFMGFGCSVLTGSVLTGSVGAISYNTGIRDVALVRTLLNVADTAAVLTFLFCFAVAVSRWHGFGIGLFISAVTCVGAGLPTQQFLLILGVFPAVLVGLFTALPPADAP